MTQYVRLHRPRGPERRLYSFNHQTQLPVLSAYFFNIYSHHLSPSYFCGTFSYPRSRTTPATFCNPNTHVRRTRLGRSLYSSPFPPQWIPGGLLHVLRVLRVLRTSTNQLGACVDLDLDDDNSSRLGCQVHMKKELDGIVVTLPSATRNMFVDGASFLAKVFLSF